MKTYLGVCLLIAILLYYWYYNIVDMNSLIEGFSDRYDKFQYDKPYLIVESNKLLCITLENDNKTISMKPYPTLNPRQLWIPVKEGTTDLRSQPDNRSCNKVTQTKLVYNPNEMLLKSQHRPEFFLHIDYNRETRTFDYTLLKKKTTKTTRVTNNLDSPIFTGVIDNRGQCASANYNCLTCTKCHQWNTECIRTAYTEHHHRYRNPYVIFYEHDRSGASWGFGEGSYAWVGWYGVWNDAVSSVRIYPGTTVRIYEHAHFGGWQIAYTAPLSGGVVDVVFQSSQSALRCSRGCWWASWWGWDWRNDKMSSFRVEYSDDNFYKTYTPYCAESRNYCQKCQVFTGQYNPLTCTDETNNLKSIRRYTFNNNELEVTHKISIVGAQSFNQNKQYVNVLDNQNNTMTVKNSRFEFYFVPTTSRAQFYQSYLIRNNLLPGNKPLIQHIERDVQNYAASQR